MRWFIVAGDPSGDSHAAKVIQAGRALADSLEVSLEIRGVGGACMAQAGADLMIDPAEMGTRLGRVGIALESLPYHMMLAMRIRRALRSFQPDVVLLVDYGGFNLQLARLLQRDGHRLAYFIPPQVWATRPGRLRVLQRTIDHVFCIFPFEEALYQQAGMSATYVGHPLVGSLPPAVSRETFCQAWGLDPQRPILAMMPGSRQLEVVQLLPAMLAAVDVIAKDRQDLVAPIPQFVLSQADNLEPAWFSQQLQLAQAGLSNRQCGQPLTVVPGPAHSLMSVADVGVIASGTATLEAALYGLPHVLVYRLPPMAYRVVRLVTKRDIIGLPNILTNQRNPIVPELLQENVTARRISDALAPFFDATSFANQRYQTGVASIRRQLQPAQVTAPSGQVMLTGPERVALGLFARYWKRPASRPQAEALLSGSEPVLERNT
jgi:lipid-A-disaccharide synthase